MTIIIVIIILVSVSIIVIFGGGVVRLREKLEPVIPIEGKQACITQLRL